jgi:ribosomal protein S18 acetylase RimI-like enzyme
MAPRSSRAAGASPPDPAKLKRESAGRYATGDGRFTVEQSSGGWMVVDGEQTDELGLPLVRGPFPTLDDARTAMEAARHNPAPISGLAQRSAALPKSPRRPAAASPQPKVEPPPIVVREYRSGDGDALRALWDEVGFRSLGDDDASLRVFVQRNPGTFLVATRAAAVLGSAMGSWDGRRGWIYHVATSPEHRRGGLGIQLVREVERRLRALGCRKVNVIVRDESPGAHAFWVAAGYTAAPARQYGRELND